MARYFYDQSTGAAITRDTYGATCADDRAAVRHAWSALPSILVEARPVLPWQQFEIIIRREDGAHVGRVAMTVAVETQKPANAAAMALADIDGHL